MKNKSAEEILATYHPISRDFELKTDLWPDSTVLMAMQEYANQSKQTEMVEMMLCPKCQGQGIVSKPPYVAAEIQQWNSSSTAFTCDICNGNKLIPKYGLVESKQPTSVGGDEPFKAKDVEDAAKVEMGVSYDAHMSQTDQLFIRGAKFGAQWQREQQESGK